MTATRSPAVCICGLLATMTFAGCGNDKAEPAGTVESTAESTTETPSNAASMDITSEVFGKTQDGDPINRYLLHSSDLMSVGLTDYGAIVTSVSVPDRDGNLANVTLGFDTLDEYRENSPYFGAICGRYANRIAGGKFKISETEYTLSVNNPPNHLHGGINGFHKAYWRPTLIWDKDAVLIEFIYFSPDGEEGYPGNLRTHVTYTLNGNNELQIDYEATATGDKATPLNLTNHCYWNLAGEGDILDHQLTLYCDKYLPVDEVQIPTGELKSVDGTPMDFTNLQTIGARIADVPGGYDHCYVVTGADGTLKPVARLVEPTSGRVLEVLSTEPGLQLYTGNFLDGSKSSGGHDKHAALCLESQHFPDSPNHPEFPNTVLQPGDVYTQTTVYRFSVDK